MDPTRPGARRHGPGRALRAAAAGILAVALVGCGDTDGSDAGPSPDVAGTGLAPDDLGAIPRPGQAEPVNAATEQGGAIAQTFELPGQQPQQILATFAELLTDAGWTETRAPEPYGTEGWRGEWLRDGQVLEISASPFAPSDDQVVSQFSMVLRSGD